MATYTANVASSIQIGIYHVPVTTLSYTAANPCYVGPPLEFSPNVATAAVILAYPFPTSGCSGLGCFPTVSLKKNGVAVGGNPSWSFDPNQGFILSYPNPVDLTGDLVLSLSHGQGVTTIDPASGHVARITVSTLC